MQGEVDLTKYYAVKVGKKPGIYLSWDECKAQVHGVKDAIFKSFNTEEEAVAFINDKETTEITSENVAYVDGSYNIENGEYSFGGVLITKNGIEKFNKKFAKDKYSSSRNVAGEIRGASFIINYAYKMGIKELDLVYDYKGIKEFYIGNWKATKELTILYHDFALKMAGKIKVNFIKVKSHSNDYYNDMADKLAKDALGIK